jgi:hypothetical protein
MNGQPPIVAINVGEPVAVDFSGSLELWKYGTHARSWFADAQKQAALKDDQDARRREIVFAVCAVESYLLEWARDSVLKGDFRRLNHYFPADSKAWKGVVGRWRTVVDHLYEDGNISGRPDWGHHSWARFADLVNFRNGLVHGRASRPDNDGLTERERPEPRAEQLAGLGPGGATNIVAEVIRVLHQAVGTPPPDWL